MSFRHEDTPKQETLDEICDLLDEQSEVDTRHHLRRLTWEDLLWLQKALVKQIAPLLKTIKELESSQEKWGY